MENAGHHGPGKHWDEQIHDIFWAEYGCERPSWIGTAGEGMAKERDDGVSTAGSGDFRLWNRPDSWNGCPALWALVVGQRLDGAVLFGKTSISVFITLLK